jgi:N6-adenosine-specific RNA methylase IME4
MYAKTDARGQQKLAIAQQLLPNTPPLPMGQFSLIVADPPWQYNLRERDQTHRNRCPYPNMTDAEIMAMPVGAIAADDAYLLLWATNNHLEIAFNVVRAWGFEFKSLHTWLKVTKDFERIRYGVGHYGRNCTEHFLVARRGRIKTWTDLGLTNIPTAFHAPINTHSEKPEEFFVIANRLGDALDGPRIELFSRKQRPAWATWGGEL